MSKSTNKVQLQQLLCLMEQNPGIARGFFKGDKQDVERFWQRAALELNSLGPPEKNTTEWKKVWTDQKKYVRQKAAQNLQHKKGTGGGPNREYKFSATEQTIYDLIGMKTSVEGVAADAFGLGSHSNTNEISEIPPETDILDVSMQDDSMNETAVTPVNAKVCVTPKTIPKPKEDSAKILLVESIKEAVSDGKEQKQSFKKIYRSLDNIYDLQKKHFQIMEKLKKEEIQQMRRHHTFMEEMRKNELEYKLEKTRLQQQLNNLTSNI